MCPKQNKELDSSLPPCTSQPLDPATAPRAWRHNIQCLLMTFRVSHPKDCSLDYLCDSGCSDRADSALLGTPSLPGVHDVSAPFFHFWLWLRFLTPTMSPAQVQPCALCWLCHPLMELVSALISTVPSFFFPLINKGVQGNAMSDMQMNTL